MLAIIIPYYKLTFFEETLKSLAIQTDKRFKVYIGDDASPENPAALLAKYQEQFDFVYHRFEENIGSISLVKQWERCIAMSGQEEWIMILGDDDVLGVNVVEEFYKNSHEVASENINVIRFATIVINKYGKSLSSIYTHPKLEKPIDFFLRIVHGKIRSSLSEFTFRKKVLQEIKLKKFPLAWHSDHLAVFECSNNSSIYTINEALVYFRSSGINISSKNDNLVAKNRATFQYYYYLLKNKKNFFFDTEQIDILCFRLEKSFLNDKKNINFWIRFTMLYMSNFYFLRYSLFFRKMALSITK